MKVLMLDGSPGPRETHSPRCTRRKSIALGKEKYGLPEKEPRQATNFIR